MYVCVCAYLYSVHKIEKNVVAEYCLPLVREGYGCFLTSDSVQYLILVLANKIVMMHRVTLCLLLEGTLEGQNCLL